MKTKLRIQDLIAKSSGVSLKNTVTVLQSLYLISDVLGQGKVNQMKEFSDTLKMWLLNARLDEEGNFNSLKSYPNANQKLACYQAYRAFEQIVGKQTITCTKDKYQDLFELEL
jgi:hypothetical protein